MEWIGGVALSFGLFVLAGLLPWVGRAGANGSLPRNDSTGIRTKWTTASPEAWAAGHRAAAPAAARRRCGRRRLRRARHRAVGDARCQIRDGAGPRHRRGGLRARGRAGARRHGPGQPGRARNPARDSRELGPGFSARRARVGTRPCARRATREPRRNAGGTPPAHRRLTRPPRASASGGSAPCPRGRCPDGRSARS
jgi:hypothetical protein